MLVHRILRGTQGDDDDMDVQGQADARFGPVRECFAEVSSGTLAGGSKEPERSSSYSSRNTSKLPARLNTLSAVNS
jgi:hypothetical protein